MQTGNQGVLDLPVNVVNEGFNRASTIKSLTIKGLKQAGRYIYSMINTNVAAGTIGKLSVRRARFENTGVPFGVAATGIGRLSYKDYDFRDSWKNITALDMEEVMSEWDVDLGDLDLRLV